MRRRVFALMLLVSACAAPLPAGDSVLRDTTLVPGVDPYFRSTPFDAETDENGIHMYERDGVRYRHPVAQTQYAISLVEGYETSGDPSWLRVAEANARDLIDNVMRDGVLEYHFDFPLHGDPENTIHAPWRSAMAQGQFLSLAVRLWQATNDPYWRGMADQTFDTLADQGSDMWVTFRDDEGYVWLEEYAGDVEPMRVLNGHIFAMYGLYDYYQATGSPEARDLFEEAGKTVLRYMPDLREPGEISWYGMRIQDRPNAQSEKYHRIHIRQLRNLYAMTQDPVYLVWASLLEEDTTDRG